MTTTEHRALPTTYALFRQYLPAQPSDTTASRLLAAAHRLDEVIATTVHQLEDEDRNDRTLAVELADRAAAGDPLEPLAKFDVGIRALLERRLALLRQSRDIAASRHTKAEQTDPALIRWRERCREVEHEWRLIVSDDDEQRRFARLSEFAARH